MVVPPSGDPTASVPVRVRFGLDELNVLQSKDDDITYF
jgi:hypothetical protein